MIQGRSYTSNNVKLLKHLDTLQDLQHNKIKPIMIHLAITNVCNLNCSFCCFKNRSKADKLTLAQIAKVLDSFKLLGVNAMEITGGGEPLLHPNINEVIEYASNLGYKIGICSNGKRLENIDGGLWDKISWIRLGMYGFDQNYIPNMSVFSGKTVKVSAAYVWDRTTSTIDGFTKMVKFAVENKIPTRVAVNAIKDLKDIEEDMETIKTWYNDIKVDVPNIDDYIFISDFNLKLTRKNNNCFMHLIKPFIFTDGNVYVCPSAELSKENNFNVNDEFKLCDIDNITDFYTSSNIIHREHKCSFCKYSSQNELIDDILTETDHNEFV